MTIINQEGQRIVLPRSGPNEFWQLIRRHFAGDSARKWRYLAMLALRENAGWPLEQIGLIFGHDKGHITRCLDRLKLELRGRFDCDWDEDPDAEPDPPRELHPGESADSPDPVLGAGY